MVSHIFGAFKQPTCSCSHHHHQRTFTAPLPNRLNWVTKTHITKHTQKASLPYCHTAQRVQIVCLWNRCWWCEYNYPAYCSPSLIGVSFECVFALPHHITTTTLNYTCVTSESLYEYPNMCWGWPSTIRCVCVWSIQQQQQQAALLHNIHIYSSPRIFSAYVNNQRVNYGAQIWDCVNVYVQLCFGLVLERSLKWCNKIECSQNMELMLSWMEGVKDADD